MAAARAASLQIFSSRSMAVPETDRGTKTQIKIGQNRHHAATSELPCALRTPPAQSGLHRKPPPSHKRAHRAPSGHRRRNQGRERGGEEESARVRTSIRPPPPPLPLVRRLWMMSEVAGEGGSVRLAYYGLWPGGGGLFMVNSVAV